MDEEELFSVTTKGLEVLEIVLAEFFMGFTIEDIVKNNEAFEDADQIKALIIGTMEQFVREHNILMDISDAAKDMGYGE